MDHPWSATDDGILPLIEKLRAFLRNWNLVTAGNPYGINAPYSVKVDVAYCGSSLADPDHKRVANAIRLHVGTEMADEFTQRVDQPRERLHQLELTAARKLAGHEHPSEAIRKVIEAHYHRLRGEAREMGLDRCPEPEEMSPLSQEIQRDIVDEYGAVEQDFRELVKYLVDLAAVLRNRRQLAEQAIRDAARELVGAVGSEPKPRAIPADARTKPMSFREAAQHMGKCTARSTKQAKKDAAEWLKNSVDDGTFACESVSRQAHIFDKNDFPKAAWGQIVPQ